MDEDLALALSLQLEDDQEIQEISRNSIKKRGLNGNSISSFSNNQPMSIVDETWELIDPVPNIHDLFLQFNQAYFDGLLAGVEVKWSSRMTLCAGLCCYEGRGGLCSIRLSQPLLKLRPRRDLVQTLLHEMIHAVLFVTHNNKDHDAHGPEFHKHMHRINKQTGTKITVYHNFHDEVNNYRQHWWKCDGPCQKRPPFFGIVRRAMNRAPSKNDTWWSEHTKTCGGKFTKIKEPDDYGKKSSKRKRDDTSNPKDSDSGSSVGNSKKSAGFQGNGKALGRNENGRIQNWFKPVAEGSKWKPKERLPLGDIPAAPVESKQQDNIMLKSSDSHVLGGGKNELAISRQAWIDKLVEKQQKYTQDRKKVISSSKNMARHCDKNKDIKGIGMRDRENCLQIDKGIGKNCSDNGNVSGMKSISGITSTVSQNPYYNSEKIIEKDSKTSVAHTSPADDKKYIERIHKKDREDNLFQSGKRSRIAHPGRSLGDTNGTGTATVSRNPSNNPKTLGTFLKAPSTTNSEIDSTLQIRNDAISSLSSSRSESTCNTQRNAQNTTCNSSHEGFKTVSKATTDGSSAEDTTCNSSHGSFQILSRTITDNSPTRDKTITNSKANQTSINHSDGRGNGRPSSIVLVDSFSPSREPQEFVTCPVCPKKIAINLINVHLDECLSRGS